MAERTWFCSDTHFGHARIVALAHRPFADVDEMDAALVRNWNERVGTQDVVYHLGDVVFKARDPAALLAALHGRIRLVRGNHDDVADRQRQRFEWIKDLAEVKVPDPEAPDGIRRLVLAST
jgi:calcineurin-like phosphoesterase family protein